MECIKLSIQNYFRGNVVRTLFGLTLFVSSIVASAQLLPNFGGQRAGLSALSFLKNDLNPQAFAMGGASIANSINLYASESNPASLALLKNNGIALSNVAVGAGINQSYLGVVYRPENYGTLGFNVNSLNSGEMEVRTEFEPNGTGQVFYVNNTAVGVNYAQKLSDRFSLGIGLRYVYEGIAEYNNHTVTGDLGFLYTTDYKDLTFAVVVKNFGGNSQLRGSGFESDFNRSVLSLEKYTTPTIFKMGFSLVPYKTEKQKLTVAAELNHPNDNAENVRLGAEMSFGEMVFTRVGYKLSVKGQNFPTFGVGIKSRLGNNSLLIDYGLNPTNQMGAQHIFGIMIPFNTTKR